MTDDDRLPDCQIMPRRMTPELNDAILKALDRPSFGRRDPRAMAWDFLTVYDAIYRIVASKAESEPPK